MRGGEIARCKSHIASVNLTNWCIMIYNLKNKIYRTLECNEWLNKIKLKERNTCSFCNDVDLIPNFVIDCTINMVYYFGTVR